MSKVANTYWVDERIRAQRVTPRTSSLASVQQISVDILGTRTDVLSPRMLRVIEDLAGDWRRLDDRIETLSCEIQTIARQWAATAS